MIWSQLYPPPTAIISVHKSHFQVCLQNNLQCFLEMFQTKVAEKIKTRNTYFIIVFKNHAVYEKMWKIM
jgi:hypothetical protein